MFNILIITVQLLWFLRCNLIGLHEFSYHIFILVIVRFNKKPRICGAFYVLLFITIMEEELVPEPEPQVLVVLA